VRISITNRNVEPAQADGVHVEEVRGQQARRLGAQESAPMGVRASGRGADSCGREDAADRARADAVSEPDELALDAAVPPPRILLGKSDDQFAQLMIDHGSS
jgi:hypothetical protein